MGSGRLIVVCAGADERLLARIQETDPAAEVRLAGEETDPAAWQDRVEVIFGFPDPAVVADAPRLRWVQLASAGCDRYMTPAIRQGRVMLTTARGVFGTAGAEHVLGMMLLFNRGLLHFLHCQRQARWDRDLSRVLKLRGQTLGIVGLGDIGSHLARRARAFEMRILAVKRTPAARPDFVDELWTTERLPDLLRQADHVALTLPLTERTHRLIDGRALDLMRRTAYLYNVGRGALVAQEELVTRLADGRLAGAGLDVFVEEPLPPEHPLWRLPNVIITPHVGADSPWDLADAAELFCANLRRYREGRPLVNVVDYRREY